MASFVSEPMLVSGMSRDFSRADVVFSGLDHSGPSFEARVFLNNPEATAATETTAAQGYAGSFFIFGHGGCAGDVGHCDVPERRRPSDWRLPHQLTPASRLVIVTEHLRQLLDDGQETIVISVVSIATRPGASGDDDVLKIERAGLVLYTWP